MLQPIVYRSFITQLIIIFFGLSAYAQTVQVTFQVDMSNETVAPSGIHIAGNFQALAGLGANWNPGSTDLADPDGDQVYSIAVQVPPGTYEYKFINGNAWGMDENPQGDCSVGPTNNRSVSVGTTDLVLPPVPFNACAPSITLSVNLSGLTISPSGVHVMGNFQEAAGYSQNWDPASTPLEDLNGDGTYEIRLSLPAGDYEYLFVNGAEPSAAEVLSLDCAIMGSNGTNNRAMTVSTNPVDPPTVCFNTCDLCDPLLDTNFDTYWWNDAVFYEIFVRSFSDSDGDGIGDFQGIIDKLDYLNDGDPDTDTDLGITGIWLMPMMESPSYHGYDATDYYTVEPDYGTMADFEAFLQEAHNRGIKVILDLVLNHTSNQHPWFTQSAANANNFRDWYIWSPNHPGYSGPWGQPVWHNNGGEFYYGLFWGGMPDLNYNHPPVKAELFNVANFWLDKGVDGFRLDAIKYLIEDGNQLENTPANFALLEEFHDVYAANNPDAVTVGEVWSNTASIIPYVQNDRLDICFEFDLAGSLIYGVNNGNPESIQLQMEQIQAAYPTLQYGTFLTNHDMDRIFNQISSNTERMKLAAALYLTLPGVPFIYYGEEVKMTGTGAHENIRRPMQWSSAQYGGFSTTAPWIGLGANYTSNNVAVMEADPNSLLNHYKKLVHIRNKQSPLRRGNYLPVSSTANQVLSFARIHDNQAVMIASNLGTATANPTFNLAASNLIPGEYTVKDLYNDQDLGTLTINGNGGFSAWTPLSNGLAARNTSILSITADPSVNTINLEPTNFDFSLFPNPGHQTINIQSNLTATQKGTITIYSSNGQAIYEGVMNGESLTLDTADWAKGVYIVQLRVNGQLSVQRLLIL